MYGDFSRLTFDATKQRTRVLQQQGRLLYDADWNEQVDILLHYMRRVTADVIGPHGGPKGNCGFEIITKIDDKNRKILDKPAGRAERLEDLLQDELFLIGHGRYYVDGLLCENPQDIAVSAQPDWRLDPEELKEGPYVAYLDVWEAHVSPAQDQSLLEIALGGVDTATRAKTAWAVRLQPIKSDVNLSPLAVDAAKTDKDWAELLEIWQPRNRGMMQAEAIKPDEDETSACTISPAAGFRGVENRLFRVEIHDGGIASTSAVSQKTAKAKGSGTSTVGRASFKSSRFNGSAVFPFRSSGRDVNVLTLEAAPRDARLGLKAGHLVEVLDDDLLRGGKPGQLRHVVKVDVLDRQVTLEPASGDNPNIGSDSKKHPFLRRWEGFKNLIEGDWIPLEEGIKVQFQGASLDEAHTYRHGDYWLIPARVISGDVEWPKTDGVADALPPAGVNHAYAPLAVLQRKKIGFSRPDSDLRFRFASLAV